MILLKKLLEKFSWVIEKERLKNTKFIIISNNCWSYEIYKILNRKYNTPFGGLFIFSACYIELLTNLDVYIRSPIKFVRHSRYIDDKEISYPLGILMDRIEIHFLHYKTEQEAAVKWQTRVSRMCRDIDDCVPIYIKIDDRDGLDNSHIEKFMLLPFANKISFGIDKQNHINHLAIKNLQDPLGNFVVNGDDLFRKRNDYFDISLWLKSGIARKTLISNIFSGRIF